MSKKLAEKMTSIKKNVNKKKKAKKTKELSKKEMEIKKRVQSLRQNRINDLKKEIKKLADEGKSRVHRSALWSDDVEIRLLGKIRDWAVKEGFKIHMSRRDIYEPPHCSDDLPADTRSNLMIEW